MALTCSVKKAFLLTFNPLFTVHKSFKNLAYVGTCLIMSSRGMLTFTCLSTSNISAWLMAFFRLLVLAEKVGVCSFSLHFLLLLPPLVQLLLPPNPSSAGLGIGCLTSLPLFKVVTALTSSILGFGSLEELNSCTPLGLGCV